MLVTAGRGTDVCRQGAMEWVEAWQSKAPAPQKLGRVDGFFIDE